jgi:SAM-dependent methyltransferase
MTDTANAAQREYWNNVAGPRWVGLQGAVERRVAVVNGLLLAGAAASPGEHVLDVGCGTGAATVPLAEAVGAQGSVTGVDISEPMLAAARKRIAENRAGNVRFVLADAQTHAFTPAAFDLVASRFGVMFFGDPAAAFRNLLGATKPGGRLCFACWGRLAENRHWLVPFEIVVRHLGPPAPSDPRAPGPFAFGDPDYVRGFLAAAGWTAIEIARETPSLVIDDAETEAERIAMMGPTARLIEEKQPDEATRAAIRRDVAAAYAALAEGGEIRLPGTVLIVGARRPA